MYCKDCIFWKDGWCGSNKLVEGDYECPGKKDNYDECRYPYDEGVGGFQTGPYFGCVHFEGMNSEDSLEERPKQTRPMNPREFARFVGENLGKYLYKFKSWDDDFWTAAPTMASYSYTEDWLYAHNTDGELKWRELPEIIEGVDSEKSTSATPQ